MSLFVFAVVLFAAFLHASWNAIVAGAEDKLLSAILIALFAAVFSACALPFVGQPAMASWPYIAASAIIHIAYYAFLAGAYRSGELSRMYPIMRGTAPLLVAVISVVFLGVSLSLPAWAGILLICLGILSLTFVGRAAGTGTAGFALANAVVIASYTLVDGAGVRVSGSAPGYSMWLFLSNGIIMVGWAFAARRDAFVAVIRSQLRKGIVGGIGTMASYGLVLWAMTEAPIPLVAALRETSILFATAIAALILKERVGFARLAAVGVVAAGAVLLRLV